MLPSHHPSNAFRGQVPAASRVRDNDAGETINIPDLWGMANEYISPDDAEKALRDLMSGGINQTEDAEIDMSEATVPGFKEDIKLLPHQILGRRWMKEREDVTQKRTGGILADDMGYVFVSSWFICSSSCRLGKTIQALTRIVEGRPRKSDRDDGWAAATLCVNSSVHASAILDCGVIEWFAQLHFSDSGHPKFIRWRWVSLSCNITDPIERQVSVWFLLATTASFVSFVNRTRVIEARARCDHYIYHRRV
jgi:hypothetical protein